MPHRLPRSHTSMTAWAAKALSGLPRCLMICRGNTCDSVMIRSVWDLLVLTLSDSVSQHFKLKDEIEALFSSACLWHSCGAGQSEPERSQHDGRLALFWSGLLVLFADVAGNDPASQESSRLPGACCILFSPLDGSNLTKWMSN